MRRRAAGEDIVNNIRKWARDMSGTFQRSAWPVALAGLITALAGCGRQGVHVLVPPLASLRPVPAQMVMQSTELTRQNFMLKAESNKYERISTHQDLRWVNAKRFDVLLREYLSEASLFQAVWDRPPTDENQTFLVFRPRVKINQYIRPSIKGTVLTLGTGMIYNILGGSACYRYVECELVMDVCSPKGRVIRTYRSSCRSAERLATDAPGQLGPLLSYAFTKTLEDVAAQVSMDNDLLVRALSADMVAKGVIPLYDSGMRIHLRSPKGIVLRTRRTRISGQVMGVDRPVLLECRINGSKIGMVPLKDTTAKSVKDFAFEARLSEGIAKIVLTLRETGGAKTAARELARTEIAYLCVPDPTAPPPEVRQRWAVVIGISDYAYGGKHFPDLKYADRDAKAFFEFLRSPLSGGFSEDHIMYLTNKQATVENVRHALFEFLAQAGKDDLVVIFFSGHGMPQPRTENFFMLCYDTRPGRLASTAFPMWDIDTALRRFVKAKRVVVLADACHAGVISSDAGAKGKRPNPVHQYLHQLALAEPGRLVFTASEARELSFESEKYGGGHGVFTHFLLKGLKGDADEDKNGLVTAGEIVEYVRARVIKATNGKQHPNPSGQFDRKLPLAVVKPTGK